MKNFRLLNTIFGWVAFAIAMVTYGLTVEPTASFWDCPEFITTAAKLEVGHPPGAPFFMLTGNVVSHFVSDPTQIAYAINLLSAFLSALTILFLFWTITHLVRQTLVGRHFSSITLWQGIVILGSGLVGALAYTFSDTFWFSAVEGEVYAYSSFLTAIVLWLMLRWDLHADEPTSDKYLILIAYIMGLSIGVHLLNLLAIPAIVLVYYFRKTEQFTYKGMLYALIASCVILGFTLYGLVPGFVSLAGYVELFFVNTLNMPFNSGALAYCITAVCVLIWSIYELYKTERSIIRIQISSLLAFTLLGIPFLAGSLILGVIIISAIAGYFYYKKDSINLRLLSTTMVVMAMMLIGYSSYAVIVIRSAANPPMDQNSPDNVFALKSFLNREQYGDRPLIYGEYFTATPKYVPDGQYCKAATTQGAKYWSKKEKLSENEKDEYIVSRVSEKYEYDSRFKGLFPRLHSENGNHPQEYANWIDIDYNYFKIDNCGHKEDAKVPTFTSNLEFFFKYQLNYMYFRYFFWNFVGRQNDQAGHGEATYGNWISGINAIDKVKVGDSKDLPAEYKDNKARNVYYALPLILGLLGIAVQLMMKKKGEESFWITLVFFFMTGIAIVLYLNQGPAEPRERDYAYAGSFYAFAIWIGFGVLAIADLLQRAKLNKNVAAVLAVLIALPVPALMAEQNWDDHDRSDRYFVRDFGMNYFNSCADNAIIFTNGDNDTFPLWYLQETENKKGAIDKRVCNLSYLQTDWYIDQMRREAYDSKPLPITWERKDYVEGKNDFARLENMVEKLDLKFALQYLKESSNKGNAIIPSKIFTVPVNKDNLVKQGAITEQEKDLIADELVINLSSKRYVTKNEIMILEMIAQNNWERPIYYAVTVGSEMYLGLDNNFQLEGLTYRLVPFKQNTNGSKVNTRLMYDNMMNKFKFGNLNDSTIYIDENSGRMAKAHRQMFTSLIEQLVAEGKNKEALLAIEKCLEEIPGYAITHDYQSANIANAYYQLGQKDKADKLISEIGENATANLKWIAAQSNNIKNGSLREISYNLSSLQRIMSVANRYNQDLFNKYYAVMLQHQDLLNKLQ